MTVNDAWRERVALEVLAPGNIGMALVMTVAAAMIAASEFAYLHSKEKMDLYYSIPVRRKKLFMSGYMTGFLMFVGIFVASEILAVLVAAAKGVSPSLLWLPFLKGSVLHIIEFLFIYSAAAFAMLFTGNTVIAVFGMMVIAGYGPAVTVITEAYIDLGFYTALKTTQDLGNFLYNTGWYFALYGAGNFTGNAVVWGGMHDACRNACVFGGRFLDVHTPQGRMRRYGTDFSENRADPENPDGTSGGTCCWHCGLQHERSKSILLAVCRIHFRSAGARHADGVYLSQGCKTGICT